MPLTNLKGNLTDIFLSDSTEQTNVCCRWTVQSASEAELIAAVDGAKKRMSIRYRMRQIYRVKEGWIDLQYVSSEDNFAEDNDSA